MGMIICSTVHDSELSLIFETLMNDILMCKSIVNYFICGMVFAGVGAGINELTALAATSELAPTAKRGKYVAVLIFTILPFLPSVL